MSVIMTMSMQGDPDAVERYASEHADEMRAIADSAKEHGLIAHRFYGADGQIMVIDEWPDPESFQRFFEAERARVEPMMREIAKSEPAVTFWRKLESRDEVGWEA